MTRIIATGDVSLGAGVIGPNAVIQLAAALKRLEGRNAAEHIFANAGYSRLLDTPPDEMVDEAIPAKLYRSLYALLPRDRAHRVALESGRLTADYVMANRIPFLVRALLRLLPASLSGPLLLTAIKKNAWTFIGSGTCQFSMKHPYTIEIENNPLKMPDCQWHAAVFERLFRCLVASDMTVSHPKCVSHGDASCQFILGRDLKGKTRKNYTQAAHTPEVA